MTHTSLTFQNSANRDDNNNIVVLIIVAKNLDI